MDSNSQNEASNGDVYVVNMMSDNQSVPTPAMYDAMRDAAFKGDKPGNIPINELEARCAKLLGKENALFVPTGTMGNLLAILIHCDRRGSELLTGDQSHIFIHEQGGAAQFGNVHTRTLTNLPDGTFDLDEMKEKIRDATDYHYPETKLVCLENAHNICGGEVLPVDFLQKVYSLAKSHGLAVHMDGARLFNAAVCLDVDLKHITQYCDSVMISFSKGLGCPAGSLVAGTRAFIEQCARTKHALGGNVKNTNMMAGAVLYALDKVYPRLHRDHRRAKILARGIVVNDENTVYVDVDNIKTNSVMLYFDRRFDITKIFDRLQQVTERERQEMGESISVVLCINGLFCMRCMTYIGITDHDIDKAVRKINYVINEIGSCGDYQLEK